MSVAVTVYATDCVARMVMDMVSNKVEEEYFEPVFNYVYKTVDCGVAGFYNIAGALQDFFNQNSE